MSTMFRSFGMFNYRVWFFGALVSNVGIWMQSIAQNWVVLTELTQNDAVAMGISMALQLAPPLLLVAVTGWVADYFPRRRILAITQSCLILISTAAGILLLNDRMTLPLMLGFSLAFGIVNAFDGPARQSFVSDMVDREFASNAVALNAASFNAGRMIGPAVGGIAIVLIGSGWVFLMNGLAFFALILALLIMRRSELAPHSRPTGRALLTDGFRYVSTRPDIVMVLMIVFLLGAFGMTFPIYGSTMALDFDRSADGFGILSSMLAIGSFLGALLAAGREQARIPVLVTAAGGFSAAMLLSSVMPTFWAYGAALMFVGLSVVTTVTTGNGYVQTTVPSHVRGRVLALYFAVFMAGAPLGAPLLGWFARELGARAAIGVGALGGLLAFAIGLAFLIRSRRSGIEDQPSDATASR